MSDFCHLHVHTEHSLLDGCATSRDYAARARELGQAYLACTDHGNVDGLIKHQRACEKHGVIPVLGCELYVVPDLRKKEPRERRWHVNVLVASDAGLENLLRMLSVANLDGFHYRPRIDPALLREHREGLVFLSACVSSFVNMPGGLDLLVDLKATNTVALEVMPHDHPLQKETNLLKWQLAADHGLPLVATADCHYVYEQQVQTQDVLMAIQTKKKWTDADRKSLAEWPLYLKSADEMAQAFAVQGVLPEEVWRQAMKNTVAVAGLCNGYTIGRRPVSLPQAHGHEGRDETELLWGLVKKGLSERVAADDPLVYDLELGSYGRRLAEEMDIICRQGFQRYFLIVHELISWCHGQGIMTGPGRGSVGGSLVAYCLYITDVDPLKYGLLFSRFISPERIDFPDIDMDFEDERRAEVRQHLADCYGEHHVAGISTFGTMKGRLALRDVARVFGVNQDEVDAAAKTIPNILEGAPGFGTAIKDTIKESQDLKAFQHRYPDVVRMAMELEGQIRQAGQHAAGVCISSEDLRHGKSCALVRRDKTLVANWDKGDAEYMGLMKLDVLGLSSLTLLNYAKRLIRERRGVEIEFDKVPLDDRGVFSEMSRGHSVGVFQMGTSLMIRLAKEMGVREFGDIVLLNALGRPGPLGSGMTDDFIARKNGRNPVIYIHPALEPYTRETLGIVIYQEQVMLAMNHLAGLDWGVCDKVRKVMGKSKGAAEFQRFKAQFIDGCTANRTLKPQDAADVWDTFASFGSYGFNKAHAVEYSLLGYWSAWLKFNYPQEFMAALLTHGGEAHKKEYVNEARRLGLVIELPVVGRSLADKWIPGEGYNLLAPFTEIKGIGAAQAEKIVDGRVGPTNKKKSKLKGGLLRDFDFVGLSEPAANATANPGPKNAVASILQRVGADGRKLTGDEILEAQEYFTFNIADKKARFKRLYELEPGLAWDGLEEDALLKCELSGVNLIKMTSVAALKVAKCEACGYHETRRQIVEHSIGRYNLMMVGEAPGPEEDEQGLGFVGRTGTNILWPEMRKHGLNPFMFHVTNVCKCFPGKGKNPGRLEVEACRPHLEAEIAALGPIVVLAFGNTGLQFFAGRGSGITKLSGETEWSDRYGCWVCWCVHPAAVLHSAANRADFERGIANFAAVLRRIGGYPPVSGQVPRTGQCPCGGDFGVQNNNYTECEGCRAWAECAVAASYGDWK